MGMGNPVWGAHVLEERNRVETYICSRLFYSGNIFTECELYTC